MRLFTTTKRGKLAIFLIVVAVLGPIAAITGGSDQSVASVLQGSVMALVIAVLLLLKDIKYMRTPTDTLWSRWDEMQDSEAQRIRMGRALSGGATIRAIHRDARVATFVGGRGTKYSTRLTSCSCPDFKDRKAPCKHIYKLASELGVKELPDPIYPEEN